MVSARLETELVRFTVPFWQWCLFFSSPGFKENTLETIIEPPSRSKHVTFHQRLEVSFLQVAEFHQGPLMAFLNVGLACSCAPSQVPFFFWKKFVDENSCGQVWSLTLQKEMGVFLLFARYGHMFVVLCWLSCHPWQVVAMSLPLSWENIPRWNPKK